MIIFNKNSHSLFIEGREIKLPYRDALVLELLIINSGSVVNKADLLQVAWSGVIVTDASLKKSISLLRHTLSLIDEFKNIDIIVTIPRVGYKLLENSIKLVDQPVFIEKDCEASIKKTCPPPHTQKKNRAIMFTLSLLNILLFLCILIKYAAFFRENERPLIEEQSISGEMSLTLVYYDKKFLKNYIIKELKDINCNCDIFYYENDERGVISLYDNLSMRAVNVSFDNGNYRQALSKIRSDIEMRIGK